MDGIKTKLAFWVKCNYDLKGHSVDKFKRCIHGVRQLHGRKLFSRVIWAAVFFSSPLWRGMFLGGGWGLFMVSDAGSVGLDSVVWFCSILIGALGCRGLGGGCVCQCLPCVWCPGLVLGLVGSGFGSLFWVCLSLSWWFGVFASGIVFFNTVWHVVGDVL